MTDTPRHVVVGRLRKPHGLKGEVSVFPLSDTPDVVFAPGRDVWVLDLSGTTLAGPLRVSQSRGYHREWLLKFKGIAERDQLERWRGLFLGAPQETLVPPADDEVYLHELVGFAVRSVAGEPLGLVSNLYEFPQGLTLEVQGPKREFLLPYRKQFVVEVDRPGRRLVIDPPDGLLD